MRIMTFFKKNMLFTIGLTLYLGVALFRSDMIMETVQYSFIYFKEFLEIIPLIVLLATIIDAWVPKAFILNKLGKDSGAMGVVYAYIIGSISAGPIYAAFPIVKLLMEKGASVTSAVIIISSWAVIKVPMLINEVKFMGFEYMAYRWSLTIIAIFIMSRMVGRWVKKEEIISDKGQGSVSPIAIESAYCIGCGLCAKLAPEDFEIEGNTAVLKETASLHPGVKMAVNKCPEKAISINR